MLSCTSGLRVSSFVTLTLSCIVVNTTKPFLPDFFCQFKKQAWYFAPQNSIHCWFFSEYAYIADFSSLCSKLFISFGMPFISSRIVPTNISSFSIAQISSETDVKYQSKNMFQIEVYLDAPFTRYLVYSSVPLT